jgi:hypothetical protein
MGCPMAYCAKCGAMTQPGDAHCRACGASLVPLPQTGVTYQTQGPPGAPAHVAYHGPDLGRPIEQGTAIIALILNIIIWPGLGSLIAGEQVGWIQGFLTLFGLVLVLTIFGIVVGVPLMVGMWIWGIVTGAQLIQRAGAQQQARYAGAYR